MEVKRPVKIICKDEGCGWTSGWIGTTDPEPKHIGRKAWLFENGLRYHMTIEEHRRWFPKLHLSDKGTLPVVATDDGWVGLCSPVCHWESPPCPYGQLRKAFEFLKEHTETCPNKLKSTKRGGSKSLAADAAGTCISSVPSASDKTAITTTGLASILEVTAKYLHLGRKAKSDAKLKLSEEFPVISFFGPSEELDLLMFSWRDLIAALHAGDCCLQDTDGEAYAKIGTPSEEWTYVE